MEHTEIILAEIEKRGDSWYRVARATGISESLFGKWKKKPSSKISSGNLALLADYLDCSADYLMGRTDNPEVNR